MAKSLRIKESKPNKSPIDHPLFPRCDGERWKQARRLDKEQAVKQQFLDAYFQINLAYEKLVAFRTRHLPKRSKARERAILQRIEAVILAKEKLEDRNAARGVVAAPVYRDGFTVDVRFVDATTAQRVQPGPVITSSASVHITIPLPAALRAKLCKN